MVYRWIAGVVSGFDALSVCGVEGGGRGGGEVGCG